jgi:transcriptional regulator with XRE-family HTH domain
MPEVSELGPKIAARRKALGLSQTELARKSRTSRATLDALENVRLGEIGFRKLTAILSALGLELELRESKLNRPTLDDLLAEGADEHD